MHWNKCKQEFRTNKRKATEQELVQHLIGKAQHRLLLPNLLFGI